MTTERSGWGKLSQSVSYHILSNIDRYMPATVVNGYCVANHLGENHTRPTPGTDYGFITALVHDFNFLEQFWANERPFFQRS
jgi:hypothetical protein